MSDDPEIRIAAYMTPITKAPTIEETGRMAAWLRETERLVSVAVAAEREACAEIAEQFGAEECSEGGNGQWAANSIARAIRARGKP